MSRSKQIRPVIFLLWLTFLIQDLNLDNQTLFTRFMQPLRALQRTRVGCMSRDSLLPT